MGRATRKETTWTSSSDPGVDNAGHCSSVHRRRDPGTGPTVSPARPTWSSQRRGGAGPSVSQPSHRASCGKVVRGNSATEAAQVRDQARAQAPARALGDDVYLRSSASTAAPTAAPWGRPRRPTGSADDGSFGPLPRVFTAVRATARQLGAAVRPETAAVLIEPIQARRHLPDRGRHAGGRPRGVRRDRCAAHLRRGADRDGADREPVGARAATGEAGRDDRGQGPRRRATRRRRRDDSRRSATCSSPATTARPSRAARSGRPPRSWRSTFWPTTSSSEASARWASGS